MRLLPLAGALFATAARPARAQPAEPAGAPRVAVICPGERTPEVEETRVRLVAELQLAGFVAELREPGASPDGRAPPRALAFVEPRAGAVAIDLIIGSATGSARHLLQVGSSAELAPAALAVRAVELLRLRLRDEPAVPRAQAPGLAAAATEVAAAPRPQRLRAHLGLAALASPGATCALAGLGLLREAGPLDELGLRGLLSVRDLTVDGAQGRARLGRGILRVQASARPLRWRALALRATVALGVLGVLAEGRALPPARAARVAVWTPIGSAGAELALAPTRSFSLALELELSASARALVVEIGDERRALPRLFPTAALAARWSF